MRNLKFRAFDTLEKKWLYGYERPNLGGFSLKGEVMLTGMYGSDLPLERFLDDVQITQFTGLRDKNGTEIYEGDILKIEFEKSRFLNIIDIYLKTKIHVVEFIGQGFNVPDIEQEFRETLATAIHNQDKPTPMWEIIGNIFENPDLVPK